MIIWLASFPRSGNTMFRVLLNRLHGVQSYDIYGDGILPERRDIADMIGHRFQDRSLDDLAAASERMVVKTHNLPDQDDYPGIYLVRDGRDALVSYAHYALAVVEGVDRSSEAERFTTTLRDLVVSTDVFGGWSANALGWVRDRVAPTVVVRFEELIADPPGLVQRALAALPVPPDAGVPSGTPPTFAELHESLPAIFRRGIAGAWREEMPDDIQDLFWDRHGEAMQFLRYAAD